VAVDAFNVTNRVNYATFVGTIGSPLFFGEDNEALKYDRWDRLSAGGSAITW
jgi:hypothetical protein